MLVSVLLVEVTEISKWSPVGSWLGLGRNLEMDTHELDKLIQIKVLHNQEMCVAPSGEHILHRPAVRMPPRQVLCTNNKHQLWHRLGGFLEAHPVPSECNRSPTTARAHQVSGGCDAGSPLLVPPLQEELKPPAHCLICMSAAARGRESRKS